MNSYDAPSLIQATISSYAARADSVHEQISRIDFVSRLALALSAPGVLHKTHLQLPCNPGLASLQEMLELIRKHAQDPFFTIAEAGLNLLETQLPSSDPDLQNLYRLRNHLFHGGALPDETTSALLATALTSAVEDTSAKIASALSGAKMSVAPKTGGAAIMTLIVEGQEYELYPLMGISTNSNFVLVFSRVTSGAVILGGPKHESKHVFLRSRCEDKLRRLFKLQQPADSRMSDLTQAVLDDLEGFREPGSSMTYVAESEGVYIRWEHASGRDTVPRQDWLRVGPNNAWQWRDGNEWKGYNELLRYLANWPVLTKRLAYMLHQRATDAKENENVLLPLPSGVEPPFIPPTVQVAPINLPKKKYTLEEFTANLDKDVEANRGTTNLYFIHAEAGAGKTTALLRTAQVRADDCAAGETGKPIFLYVSARGNVLENLDMAINAAVAETRLLTSDGVRALCRNGLIIPIIDGFDELVGSPTYADALASLRPWLQNLGGRGVIVVSARSNYFVSLYKESIRNQSNSDINVLHLIAELDRWEPDERDGYLEKCGVKAEQLKQVPLSELELLRLPFFARASIGHLLAGETNHPGGLIQKLMRGYVEREQGKLQGADGEIVVTAEDLENFFEELAAYMMENNTREVPLDDLTFNAEYSFKSPMSPDVRNRLAALCGLDVNEGRRFRFMHEILLDFFFGQRVGRNLCDEGLGELQRILTRSRLTVGAARVAVGMCPPKPAILTALTKAESTGLVAGALRSNVGALWREIFSSGHSVSNTTIDGVNFPPMELSGGGLNSVGFSKCDFTSLSIANPEGANLRFLGCTFQELRLVGSGKGLVFNECAIDVVSTSPPLAYAEEPEEVNQALRKAGATVVARASGMPGSQSEFSRRAQFFLEKINGRAELSIVVNARDNLPVDGSRFGWITRNAMDWLKFLDALKEHELASLEHIDTGGAPKQRLHWVVQPEDILDQHGTAPGVRDFWAMVASGTYD